MAKKVSTETLKTFNKKANEDRVKTLAFSTDEDNKIEFELEQYLSINEKRVIVELVVGKVFVEDEIRDLKYLDKTVEEMLTTYCIVKYYTNITPVEDLFEMYDIVTSTGLIDFIKENISEKELESVYEMINVRVEEEFRLQDLENSMGYKLENTLDVINRKVAEALDVIKLFNKDDLNVFGEGTAIEDAMNLDIGLKEDVSIIDEKETKKEVKDDSNTDIGESEE